MNPLATLPAVSRLLSEPEILALSERHGLAVITRLIRETLAEARTAALDGAPVPEFDRLIEQIGARATALARPRLRPVFNLTGTVLHAPISDARPCPRKRSRHW
ncbi:MAG: hypothetical protein MZV65_42440 [Chromatiales bacterium]|nr:hypothetical protein [Chromatiales bacterium]